MSRYRVNLWDILPEIQVAGVTENGALVVDGCRAAAIRWKDFPEVAFVTTDSSRRTIIGFVPYLSWPALIIGLGIITTYRAGGIALIIIGVVLLILSPRLFVQSIWAYRQHTTMVHWSERGHQQGRCRDALVWWRPRTLPKNVFHAERITVLGPRTKYRTRRFVQPN